MAVSDNADAGELEIHPHEHAVLVGGEQVPLSSKEFDIITMLAEHPGWVFSAGQLSSDVNQEGFSPESVSVLVSRIRHKLAEAGAPGLVETVRGLGYRLRADVRTVTDAPPSTLENHELRDACWQLQEAVIEVEHSGSQAQRHQVAGLLDKTRRDVYLNLAE